MKKDPLQQLLLGVVGVIGALFALALAGRVLARLLSAGLIVILLAVGVVALISYIVVLAVRLRSAEAGVRQAMGSLHQAKKTETSLRGLMGLSKETPPAASAPASSETSAGNDEPADSPPARRILAGKSSTDR